PLARSSAETGRRGADLGRRTDPGRPTSQRRQLGDHRLDARRPRGRRAARGRRRGGLRRTSRLSDRGAPVRAAAAALVTAVLLFAPGAGASGYTYTIEGVAGDNGWYRSAVVV